MKRIHYIMFLLLFSVSTLFGATMDTTRVSWDGISNRLCLERLVWCGLSEVTATDSSTFVSYVQGRSGSIFDWGGYFQNNSGEYAIVLCVVQIPSNVDLATEAAIYRNSSLTDDAGPLFAETQPQWPNDTEYVIADGVRQWYLHDIEDFAGSINWLPVTTANGLGQRGRSDVVIGIIDSGISLYDDWHDEDDLSVGDLMNHEFMGDPRFTLGRVFDINNEGKTLRDLSATGHGTGITSVLAAVDHDSATGQGGAAEEFGMIGVNTQSEIYINSVGGDEAYYTFDIVNAILHCWSVKGCDIIVIPSGVGAPEALYEWLFDGMEWIYDAPWINHIPEPPLCVCSSGNYQQTRGVLYPAAYAFYGDPNQQFYPHPNGYRYVMSVGGHSSNAMVWGSSSFVPLEHRVSCVGPADDIRFALRRDVPEDAWYQFDFDGGTSFAAPIVAGVASLVLSECLNNGKAIKTYELRTIIERTCRDVNFGGIIETRRGDLDASLFDVQMGYGIVDCYKAATNVDLNSFEIEANTCYWISSRVEPVKFVDYNDENLAEYCDPRRVIEELTWQDDNVSNRIVVLEKWDADGDIELEYDPSEDLWGENPWDDPYVPEWEWDFHEGYCLTTNGNVREGEKLTIVGQLHDINEQIQLQDGWNWVAYFPDWEDDAEDVLGSIASSGDPDSELILAKGQNGNFYLPAYSFSNLTMRPGEGYRMQMDTCATLIYPTTQPCSINDNDHRESIPTKHFHFISRTGDFLPILVESLSIDNRQIAFDDEIGIFINDTMCVGAVVVGNQLPIGFAAWRDNMHTNRIEGFNDLENLSFYYWDDSEEEEISQEDFRISSVCSTTDPDILTLNLKFTGSVKESTIPEEFGLISVFPNPFNNQTVIRYSIAEPSEVCLNIYDINGRLVKSFANGFVSQGQYRTTWNATAVAAGSYIVELTSGDSKSVKRVELVK